MHRESKHSRTEIPPGTLYMLVLKTLAAVASLALGTGADMALSSVLLGVSPCDPVTLGAVCMLLLAVAVLASLLPALRASKVDPVKALRNE
jgi:ABC-type lipoprotein release transport system permease subunit